MHWLSLDIGVADGKLKLCDGGVQLLELLLNGVELALGDNEVAVDPAG
jgi:hypothetical protein